MSAVATDALVEVRDLTVHFPIRRGIMRRTVAHVRAVNGIDLNIRRQETVGLVGESGCGKSTAAMAILGLVKPTGGTVMFNGHDLTSIKGRSGRRFRRHIQIIFQNPYSALNPRLTVGQTLTEPLVIHEIRTSGAARSARVEELLNLVGLNPTFADRFPSELSGGQRQRVGIARALALEPEFIICDEPVSSLDVSIQAQVLNLLKDLQSNLGLTYLFIGHGLDVVRYVSDRIAVMYLGKIVEIGPAETLYRDPRHPYTRALWAASPIPDPVRERARERTVLGGEVPSPIDPPRGCRFHPRCPFAVDRCRVEEPALVVRDDGRSVACWRADEIQLTPR